MNLSRVPPFIPARVAPGMPMTVVLLLFALTTPAEAYIGPGAGFAFIGSFFVLLWAVVLALFTQRLRMPAADGLRYRKGEAV